MVVFIDSWSDSEAEARASRLFTESFHEAAESVYAAPGRVNLIGEHTDYNGGLCLPIALPHVTACAFTLRNDNRVRVVSEQGDLWEGTIEDISPDMPRSWVNYAVGPAWTLGVTRGFDAAITSCVPLGAGLSSSAAIECAVAVPLAEAVGVSGDAVVQACIRAENEVAHAPTGGLDQTASYFGQKDMALFLDFTSNTRSSVPVTFDAAGLALMVVDTHAHHTHADGGYGSRREECTEAARLLNVSSLRFATLEGLESLPADLADRVRHVILENERVEKSVEALKEERFEDLGRLFFESHDSMRDDFVISCPELDVVVDVAKDHGALGARMTGGGFGGSAIALVRKEDVEDIGAAVSEAFEARGFGEPSVLVAQASSGARRLR